MLDEDAAWTRADDVRQDQSRLGARTAAGVADADDGHRISDEAINGESARKRPAAPDLLNRPDALLTRSDLRELGLQRRAIDAVFRACRVVFLPGYSRGMIRVADYLALLDGATFDDRHDDGRVRAT